MDGDMDDVPVISVLAIKAPRMAGAASYAHGRLAQSVGQGVETTFHAIWLEGGRGTLRRSVRAVELGGVTG